MSFRRPARIGSPRSAKRDGSKSLCFLVFFRIMTWLIILQLTYCPLRFVELRRVPKGRSHVEKQHCRNQFVSGSAAQLTNDRLPAPSRTPDNALPHAHPSASEPDNLTFVSFYMQQLICCQSKKLLRVTRKLHSIRIHTAKGSKGFSWLMCGCLSGHCLSLQCLGCCLTYGLDLAMQKVIRVSLVSRSRMYPNVLALDSAAAKFSPLSARRLHQQFVSH